MHARGPIDVLERIDGAPGDGRGVGAGATGAAFTTPPLDPLLPVWPSLLGLAMIAACIVSMIVIDVVVARRVATTTALLLDNSQRSVELVDDLREDAHRLAEENLTDDELASRARAALAVGRAYEPLATYEGEASVWQTTRGDLEQLVTSATARDHVRTVSLVRSVTANVDRLVAINRASAASEVATIQREHRGVTVVDSATGAGCLVVTALVALALRRLVARQRQLVTERIALVEQRNRELDAFSGRVAHDLRSPLGPIRGFAELLLLKERSPSDVRAMALRIRSSVDRMSGVIEAMLALAQSGRAPRGRAVVAEVARDALESMSAELHEATIELDLCDAAVGCTPDILAQILVNLMGNAAKYRSPERRLRLRLGAVASSDRVTITVEDNARGMDAETVAHAFEPFFRGQAGLEQKGHGLGLSIVDRIVLSLGGACRLESRVGRGTAVTVVLPRA